MNICVYGAASNLIDKAFLDAGEELGEIMAKRGHSLVFGGGAEGMMGAVARGVERIGGKTIGISPTFFKVDGVLFDRCSEFFYTETMRERKKLLEEKSDAFLISPGGIGTYDEFFEILSLRQLGRHHKPIVLFNVNGYFDTLLEMLKLTAEKNFMKEKNLSLIFVTDDPSAAVSHLENYTAENSEIQNYR